MDLFVVQMQDSGEADVVFEENLKDVLSESMEHELNQDPDHSHFKLLTC